MAKCVIELNNMEFRAFHGCYPLERKVGGLFRVSLRVEAEIGDAATRDDVSQTINYLTLYELVREQMAIPANIIEAVAERIAEAIREAFARQVAALEVKVAKLAPPLGGKVESVSATVRWAAKLREPDAKGERV